MKNKLIDLENKALFNQHNLNQIDELYKKLSNLRLSDKIEQIEKPLKIDDELVIKEKVIAKTSLPTTTKSTAPITFSATKDSPSINSLIIKTGLIYNYNPNY